MLLTKELTWKRLSEPFKPSEIQWRAREISGGHPAMALAEPYVSMDLYMNRLDEVSDHWSMEFKPVNSPSGEDWVFCAITVAGVTRSNVGQARKGSPYGDKGSAVEATEMAFARACATFGLGRHLEKIPELWIEWDENTGHFTEKGMERLHEIAVQCCKSLLPNNRESESCTQ